MAGDIIPEWWATSIGIRIVLETAQNPDRPDSPLES
jgi:hypothetical protein